MLLLPQWPSIYYNETVSLRDLLCVYGHMYMNADARGVQKRVSDPLELELLTDSGETPDLGAGNQIWVLSKSNACS